MRFEIIEGCLQVVFRSRPNVVDVGWFKTSHTLLEGIVVCLVFLDFIRLEHDHRFDVLPKTNEYLSLVLAQDDGL